MVIFIVKIRLYREFDSINVGLSSFVVNFNIDCFIFDNYGVIEWQDG